MSVEEIPSDELVIMNKFWHRAFNAAGCDPMCHCCYKMIPVGDTFKLATVKKRNFYSAGNNLEFERDVYVGTIVLTKKMVQQEFDMPLRKDYIEHDKKRISDLVKALQPTTNEVMLCEKCTTKMFEEKVVEKINGEIAKRDKPKGGCFRINGKIIH